MSPCERIGSTPRAPWQRQRRAASAKRCTSWPDRGSPRHNAASGRVSPSLPTVTTENRIATLLRCATANWKYRDREAHAGSAGYQGRQVTKVTCTAGRAVAESTSKSAEPRMSSHRADGPEKRFRGDISVDAALGLRFLGAVSGRRAGWFEWTATALTLVDRARTVPARPHVTRKIDEIVGRHLRRAAARRRSALSLIARAAALYFAGGGRFGPRRSAGRRRIARDRGRRSGAVQRRMVAGLLG